MKNIPYTYWHSDDKWLGHLDDYPEYLTQGETLADLEDYLLDIHREITGGQLLYQLTDRD